MVSRLQDHKILGEMMMNRKTGQFYVLFIFLLNTWGNVSELSKNNQNKEVEGKVPV